VSPTAFAIHCRRMCSKGDKPERPPRTRRIDQVERTWCLIREGCGTPEADDPCGPQRDTPRRVTYPAGAGANVRQDTYEERRRPTRRGPKRFTRRTEPCWRRLTRRSPSTSARGRPLQERPRRTCLAVFGPSQAVTRLNGRPRQLRA
jgi:hypothetical protein